MSKKFKVSEDFILEAHKAACGTWKERIKGQFPEVFGVDANQWMYIKDKEGREYLWFYEGKETTETEGFFRGKYRRGEDISWHTGLEFARKSVKADEKDIKRIFLAEIVKRGYDGSYIDTLNQGTVSHYSIDLQQGIELAMNDKGLEIIAYTKCGGYTLYKNGEWINKVVTLTKEQAEKEYKIKIKG